MKMEGVSTAALEGGGGEEKRFVVEEESGPFFLKNTWVTKNIMKEKEERHL